MGWLRWAPAAGVGLLALGYGRPVELCLSATVVVLAATVTWSLPGWRIRLGVSAAAVSLIASGWAWRTLDHSFLDASADSDKVLLWTVVEVAALSAVGSRLVHSRLERRCGWLLLAAGAATAVRLLPDAPVAQQLFLAGLGTTAVGSAVLLGRHLDRLARTRTEAVHQARAQQRRTLAADLHDYVAHDVSAIAVLAQSLRLVHGPEIDESVRQIERAATRALRRLDRSIELLRGDPGLAQPWYRLADVPELAAAHPIPVVLVATVDDTEDIPAIVQDAAHRVVIEALTNVTRHAPDAAAVEVSLTRDDRQLHLVVVNDVHPSGSEVRGASAGTGLSALGERVRALGGAFQAGVDRSQWRVTASLPLD